MNIPSLTRFGASFTLYSGKKGQGGTQGAHQFLDTLDIGCRYAEVSPASTPELPWGPYRKFAANRFLQAFQAGLNGSLAQITPVKVWVSDPKSIGIIHRQLTAHEVLFDFNKEEWAGEPDFPGVI